MSKFSVKKAITNLKKYGKVFLSGPGGTGKSYIVKQLKERADMIVLATTGIAAAQIGGMTVHKFFKLGICKNVQELEAYTSSSIEKIMSAKEVEREKASYIFYAGIKNVLKNCEFIVIDEVSMMSAEVLDMVFHRLVATGFSDIPILFVGDMYQLPPVSKGSVAKFVFESKHWKDVKVIELTEIKRTSDLEFANMQKEVRIGKPSMPTLSFIQSLENNEVDENVIKLLSLNKHVQAHNTAQLLKVEGKLYKSVPLVTYRASNIDEATAQRFIDDLNLEQELYFKKGAKVLFTSNARDGSYFNGELGVIEAVIEKDKSLIIKSEFNGDEYLVSRVDFQLIKYVPDGKGLKEEELLRVAAYPFKLGYALTIHKSQGMTLSEGFVDCSGIFLKEQFYVAFSRFTSPSNVCIKNFDAMKHIGSNDYINDFYANCDKMSLEDFAYIFEGKDGKDNEVVSVDERRESDKKKEERLSLSDLDCTEL